MSDHDAQVFYENWYREPLLVRGCEVAEWEQLSDPQKEVWSQIRANVDLCAGTIRNLQEALQRV